MPALQNEKWELFAQGLAAGEAQCEAYAEAGYKPSDASASRLSKNVKILNRVAELQSRAAARVSLSKSYILDAAVENLEKALGRKPVKITRREKVGEDEYEDVETEVYIYKGDVANQAIRMLGSEFNLFTERKEVRISNEFDKLTDEQLAQRLVEVGQQMLLGGPVIEHQDDEGEE